ncbi:MAG: P-loop NTPase [Oscillospiraceae bacterium]
MANKVIMLASGKGGTGKSTVSVLLGAALAKHGSRVLLIELDSGLRSVDIISGVYGKTVYDIEDILSGRCEAAKAVSMSTVFNGLSVISAPYSGGSISAGALRAAVNKLGASYDIVLLDTAAGMGDAFTAASEVAYNAILVLTPDAITLRDGRIAADYLFATKRVDVKLLINKADAQLISAGGIKDIDECIDTVGATLLGIIPNSAAIMSAGVSGQPLSAKSLEAKVFDNIARRILGEEVPLLIR